MNEKTYASKASLLQKKSRSLKKNRGFRSTHSLQMSDEFSLTFRVTESFFSAHLVLGNFFCKIFLLANQFSNSIFFQNLQ